jgi:glycosyltransferase involved in cell wall biosynthesis
MKICYLADGQSIHTKRWCDHFSELGHTIHLITFRDTKIENIKVHYINTGNISSAGGNWKVLLKVGEIKKILSNIRPDIVHAHYATSYGIAGALTGYHPYIITALGSDILISAKNSFIYQTLVKYALKKADWITAMAEHMKKVIVEFGIDQQKVTTVMFGIDPAVFNHNNRKVSEEKFIITSTRNFEPVYNIPLLLNALNLIHEKIPNLSVHLIGDGSQRDHLQKMTADLGLKDLITFHGKITQNKIARILNQSHVFVTSSLSDGNNVSLNEAMACGAISLATDIPANRDWVKNDINGFLVPTDKPEILADKILYVYNNYTELEKKTIPFNDKIISEKALWPVNMALVENKYRELTQRKKSSLSA